MQHLLLKILILTNMIKNNKKYSHTNIKKLSINSLLKKAGVVSAYDRHQISELVKTTLGKELDYDLLFDNHISEYMPKFTWVKHRCGYTTWDKGKFTACILPWEDYSEDGPLDNDIMIGYIRVEGVGTRRYHQQTITSHSFSNGTLIPKKSVFRDRKAVITKISIHFDFWGDHCANNGKTLELEAWFDPQTGTAKVNLNKVQRVI
jgi:hypothetical protein